MDPATAVPVSRFLFVSRDPPGICLYPGGNFARGACFSCLSYFEAKRTARSDFPWCSAGLSQAMARLDGGGARLRRRRLLAGGGSSGVLGWYLVLGRKRHVAPGPSSHPSRILAAAGTR